MTNKLCGKAHRSLRQVPVYDDPQFQHDYCAPFEINPAHETAKYMCMKIKLFTGYRSYFQCEFCTYFLRCGNLTIILVYY